MKFNSHTRAGILGRWRPHLGGKLEGDVHTMSRKQPTALLSGLAMGESPRWHEHRLWVSDWGAQEIVATDLVGNREVVVRTPFGLPFCFDWLPDGQLLIVAGRESRLMRREPDGSLAIHADLRGISD